MQESDCIFCKIAQGSVPSFRIWESNEGFAFLDVGPLSCGHLLLIPKKHYRDIRDVPEALLGHLTEQIPRLAAAVMQATNATGLNLLQNTGQSSGQAVFHIHFHLIPRKAGDGLGYRWNAGSYEKGEGEAICAEIIDQLKPK